MALPITTASSGWVCYCLFQTSQLKTPRFQFKIFRQHLLVNLLVIYCFSWFQPGSEEDRRTHISKSLVTCQSPMLICLSLSLKTWMKTAKSPGKSPAMVKWNPTKRDLFAIKPGSSNEFPSFKSFRQQPSRTESLRSEKGCRELRYVSFSCSHLSKTLHLFVCSSTATLALYIKILRVPSEFRCKVVVQYSSLTIYMLCPTVSSPRTGCGEVLLA